MAGIDFSKFSDNFKKLWEEAIKDDKKVTLEEFAKFSPEDQKKLTELLAGNPDAIGDGIKIVQKEYKCGEDTLELYLGKPNEGDVNLTGNYKKDYPNAKIGFLKDGVLTLLDPNNKPITDNNGKPVKFTLTEQEKKFRLPLQIEAVRKETRLFMLDLLKQEM